MSPVWTVYTSKQELRRYHVDAPTAEEARAAVYTRIRERRHLPAVACEWYTDEEVLDAEEGAR